MARRVPSLLVALVCAWLAACSDDTTTPTNPSPQPGATTLAITPQTDFLTIGTIAPLQATLTDSSGSRVVAADWSVDDGRIAGVDRQGRVTALASGTTNIRAAFQQRTATLAVRVAPDYSGSWSGPMRVTACTNPTPTICQTNYPVGTQYVARVTLAQSRDQVVGTLYQPYLATVPTAPALVVDGTLSGRIELDGRLPMTGTLVGPTPTAPSVGNIPDWRTAFDPTQPILRGSYTEVTTSGGTSSIAWEFIGLTRSAR
jgi:hypothetical protein